MMSQAPLSQFQQWLAANGIHWFWVPSSDPHLNEYIPDAWQRRTQLSGFTGSAGDLLVGQATAWLFADSRYHEQADQEVDTSLIQVSKLGKEGELSLKQRLEAELNIGPLTLGLDANTLSAAQVKALKPLEAKGLTIKAIEPNPVDAVLPAQPERGKDWATDPIYSLPLALTGRSIEEKLALLRETLSEHEADWLPLSKLDEVAWLFNLRGSDIAYNPVFLSYALVTPTHAFLFTEASRLTEEAQAQLNTATITLLPYESFFSTLTEQAKALHHLKVLWTSAAHTWALQQHLETLEAQLVELAVHPVATRKALKTEAELKAMRAAHEKSSRAITKMLDWLDACATSGKTLTEKTIADTLEGFYKEEEGFVGLSFNTIAGAGPASSIVHYGTPDATRPIQPGDWILVDSGAHYRGGTTDCTRTLVYGGQATERQKRYYTLVLKAFIAGASAVFPKGTNGVAIDAITRAPLWQAGLDFGHGTGHGVGAHLNVHEGPNGIHKRATTPLEPGHVCSIEPGYYEPGWGGIRLENLAEVVEANLGDLPPGTPHTTWYRFESLTQVRFDGRLIVDELLTEAEKAWLNSYQKTVSIN